MVPSTSKPRRSSAPTSRRSNDVRRCRHEAQFARQSGGFSDRTGDHGNVRLLQRGTIRRAESIRTLGIGFVACSLLGRGFLTGQIRSMDQLGPDDFRANNPRGRGDARSGGAGMAPRAGRRHRADPWYKACLASGGERFRDWDHIDRRAAGALGNALEDNHRNETVRSGLVVGK